MNFDSVFYRDYRRYSLFVWKLDFTILTSAGTKQSTSHHRFAGSSCLISRFERPSMMMQTISFLSVIA